MSMWVSQTIASQPLHYGFPRSQASWDQRWPESSSGTCISCLTPLYTYVPSRQTSSCTWMLLMMEASLSPKKHLLFLVGTSLDPLSFIQQILFKHLVCAGLYIKNQGCSDWVKASSLPALMELMNWWERKPRRNDCRKKKSLKDAGTEVQVRDALEGFWWGNPEMCQQDREHFPEGVMTQLVIESKLALLAARQAK